MKKIKKEKQLSTSTLTVMSNRPTQHIPEDCFSEAQGRDWRFRCIARLYSAEQYQIILTGHTATDRAETALLQLIRGTSFRGMVSLGRTKTFKSVYPKYFNYSVFLCSRKTC